MKATINSHRVLILAILAIAFFPAPSFPDPDKQIQELKNSVLQLSQKLSAQEERLNRLEMLLNVKELSQSGSLGPTDTPIPTKKKGPIPLWHDPANWRRIKNGMTQQQVLLILGKPTAVKKFGTQVTYLYEGVVHGSGFVKGSVLFFDNRIEYGAGLSIPAFLSE